MTNFVFADNVNTVLASALSSGGTALTVSSTSNIPSSIPTGYVFPLTLNDAATGLVYEIVYATAVSGATFTVLRGQEGTTAANWNIGDAVYCAPTAGQMQSLQFSSPIIGDARNLKMSISTASASGTMTADEIVLKSVLGSSGQIVSAFNSTITLTTVGANGMDTGSPPNNGFVALYAIYNPTTFASALLATNATSASAPNIYAGGAMPSGYVHSALVAVWPTNGSALFLPGLLFGRKLSFANMVVLGPTATTQSSPTALSLLSVVPLNAKKFSGLLQISNSGGNSTTLNLYSENTVQIYGQQWGASASGAFSNLVNFNDQVIFTPQQIYYTAISGGGTASFEILVTGYEI